MNSTIRTIGIIALVALAILKLIQYMDRPIPNSQKISDKYESQWQDAETQMEQMIREELKEHHITACTDLYIKKSRDGEGGIALACTNDGENFKYYIMDFRGSHLDQLNDDGISKPKSLKY